MNAITIGRTTGWLASVVLAGLLLSCGPVNGYPGATRADDDIATPPEDVAPRRVVVALDVGLDLGRARGAAACPRVRAPLLWPGTATQPVVAQAWTTRWRAATRLLAHRGE